MNVYVCARLSVDVCARVACCVACVRRSFAPLYPYPLSSKFAHARAALSHNVMSARPVLRAPTQGRSSRLREPGT